MNDNEDMMLPVVEEKEKKKTRTRREVFRGDFDDIRMPTSFDVPVDIYCFVKTICKKRKIYMKEFWSEAAKTYL